MGRYVIKSNSTGAAIYDTAAPSKKHYRIPRPLSYAYIQNLPKEEALGRAQHIATALNLFASLNLPPEVVEEKLTNGAICNFVKESA